jgi:TatD DNase family protein
MFIDTHCHLNHERLRDDLAECLERAIAADVRKMIVVGYDAPSSEEAVKLSLAHAGTLYAAIGIHPHDATTWNDAIAARFRALACTDAVVAIGEIGLDFYRDLSPREQQYRAFQAQLQLAEELNLPVIIHCREAYEETLAILASHPLPGVMHCWGGTPEQARWATSLGLALGFGGTLTFPSAHNVRDSATCVALEHLLLETDAPYLAPVPYRGKRNEPAFTRLVAEKLAALRGLDLDLVASITTQNAYRLFPKLADSP